MSQKPKTSICLGRMCTPVFHVIISASVLNSYAFLARKALLHSQQRMVQNKAAEQQVGASFIKPHGDKSRDGGEKKKRAHARLSVVFLFMNRIDHASLVILPI